MFCGNIFTSTNLQNHKKNHMKKSPKRFHRVKRALFLSLSNEFVDQKVIPKISSKKIWSAPCFPKIVCGGQCERELSGGWNLSDYPSTCLAEATPTILLICPCTAGILELRHILLFSISGSSQDSTI